MREIVRRAVVNALSLFLVSLFFTGLQISGGFVSFIYAGALLSILTIIFDPIVKLITLPFNLITLGLLSFLTTLVALFVLSYLYKNLAITSFTFQGISVLGVEIHQIHFSFFLSYVVISATIYFLNKILSWIFDS